MFIALKEVCCILLRNYRWLAYNNVKLEVNEKAKTKTDDCKKCIVGEFIKPIHCVDDESETSADRDMNVKGTDYTNRL